MAKTKTTTDEIIIRPATPSDATMASKLIFATSPKKLTFIIGLGSEARAKSILEKIFPLGGHRLSYEFTEIISIKGRVVGIVIAYPGHKAGKLDRRLDKIMLQQYRLRGKLALIARALPLFFIKEAEKDEYLLSSLAVNKRLRGQGIGSHILSHIEARAQQAGLTKVALMVSIDNQPARRFYERNGYAIKALHLETNKRVPYIGHGYQRMVKELD